MNNKTIPSEEIVNRQLEAYNQKDYELFISFYDKEIISYDLATALPNPSMSGKHFFQHYKNKFFQNPNIECIVTKRIIFENFIFDEEIIKDYQNRNHKECVIYQVHQNLIVKMWFTPIIPIFNS